MLDDTKVGQRVRIHISPEDAATWHAEAVAAFQGKTGVVMVAYPDTDQYLVAFDAPAEKWALRSADPDPEVNQITSWHFKASELEPNPGPCGVCVDKPRLDGKVAVQFWYPIPADLSVDNDATGAETQEKG